MGVGGDPLKPSSPDLRRRPLARLVAALAQNKVELACLQLRNELARAIAGNLHPDRRMGSGEAGENSGYPGPRIATVGAESDRAVNCPGLERLHNLVVERQQFPPPLNQFFTMRSQFDRDAQQTAGPDVDRTFPIAVVDVAIGG